MSQKDKKRDLPGTIAACVIVAIWVITVLCNAFFQYDNAYSKAAAQAPFILKMLGLVAFAVIPVILRKAWTSEWVRTGRIIAACFALLVLGTLSFIGFGYPFNVG